MKAHGGLEEQLQVPAPLISVTQTKERISGSRCRSGRFTEFVFTNYNHFYMD